MCYDSYCGLKLPFRILKGTVKCFFGKHQTNVNISCKYITDTRLFLTERGSLLLQSPLAHTVGAFTWLCMCWASLAVTYVGVSKSSIGLPFSFSYFSLYLTWNKHTFNGCGWTVKKKTVLQSIIWLYWYFHRCVGGLFIRINCIFFGLLWFKKGRM